jgi:hypothetical protein
MVVPKVSTKPRLMLLMEVAVVAAAAVTGEQQQQQASWMDRGDSPQLRAHKLVQEMNATEMIALFHGSCGGYTGNVCPNTRLGIPQLKMNDGPQGFRGAGSTSTAFPAAITIAASWDATVANSWGKAMGDEFYRKGANVQLGPGLCLARVPRNGRNFEYVSGEDPLLGMRLGGAVVQGIQSMGVVANAKHWVNNNQETDRHYTSENVDERVQVSSDHLWRDVCYHLSPYSPSRSDQHPPVDRSSSSTIPLSKVSFERSFHPHAVTGTSVGASCYRRNNVQEASARAWDQ